MLVVGSRRVEEREDLLQREIGQPDYVGWVERGADAGAFDYRRTAAAAAQSADGRFAVRGRGGRRTRSWRRARNATSHIPRDQGRREHAAEADNGAEGSCGRFDLIDIAQAV